MNKQDKRPHALLSLLVWLLPNSSFKHWALRRMGHQIGTGVTLGANLVINCGWFRFDDGSILQALNLFRNLSRVEVGHDSIIGHFNQFTAAPVYQQFSDRVGVFRMGAYTLVTHRHYLDCSGQVIIGYHSAIAGIRCLVQSHEIDLVNDLNTVGRIIIGDYSVVNTASLLLKDAELPDHSILAAGSVLVKTREDEMARGLYAGAPAKHVKELPHLKWYDRDPILNDTMAFDDSKFYLEPL